MHTVFTLPQLVNKTEESQGNIDSTLIVCLQAIRIETDFQNSK